MQKIESERREKSSPCFYVCQYTMLWVLCLALFSYRLNTLVSWYLLNALMPAICSTQIPNTAQTFAACGYFVKICYRFTAANFTQLSYGGLEMSSCLAFAQRKYQTLRKLYIKKGSN